MGNKFAVRVTWVLLILIIIMGAVRIYLDLHNQDLIKQINSQITSEVLNQVKAIKVIQPKDGIDGKDGVTTVVHDYTETTITLPGTPGDTGEAGKSAYDIAVDNGFVGTEQDWLDSLTAVIVPELKCNTVKNRWEVKYSPDGNWQLLNGEIVPCLGV